jgi:hypothetical protein
VRRWKRLGCDRQGESADMPWHSAGQRRICDLNKMRVEPWLDSGARIQKFDQERSE